jgi:hypothetical protein
MRRPEHLIGRHCGISRQDGHSFGDHLISESVSVKPSSVIEPSIVLCVFMTCVKQCPISLRSEHPVVPHFTFEILVGVTAKTDMFWDVTP